MTVLPARFTRVAPAGTWTAVAGLVLVTVAFYFKARAEERFLASEFGGAYDDYRKRVPMLIPF